MSDVTACPHTDASEARLVCIHLLADKELDRHLHFTGTGKEYLLVCLNCHRTEAAVEENLRRVCLKCFTEIDDEWIPDSVSGQPEIVERATSLRFVHTVVALATPVARSILTIQPVGASSEPIWVALTTGGDVVRINLATRTANVLVRGLPPELDLQQSLSLCLSADGAFAAITNTHGQYGVVFDLRSGAITMHLERDDYHIAHSVFPTAFFTKDERLLLVHGTAWNRLDVSDPQTGELLTVRTWAPPEIGNRVPKHSLDYFHSSLLVSPDQAWIADNGWVWSPVGMVRTWSLLRWLHENVWESEDGPSVRKLCQRWYYWDGPICWVNDRTLAVWGWGGDVDFIIPAVRLFDVKSGKEDRWFPGPIGTLVFDTYLFSFAPDQGTSVWDVTTEERLLHDAAFCPTAYHLGTHQFLTLLPDGAFQISQLEEARQ